MKTSRWILVLGVLAMAACSSPTLPKIPQDPNTDPTTKPDPNKQGFVMPVVTFALHPGSFID
ncbi:MAG: hypothetical protein LJF04_16390 [Gemmatimonadetes bacterium]|nr:hypothetical protein [Gemmatimonadota bacterium]